MFQIELLLSIVAVLAVGIFGILKIGRMLRGDLKRGTVLPGTVLALRLAPIAFILGNLLFVLPLPIRLLFTRTIAGDISQNLNDFVAYFPDALLLEAVFLLGFVFLYHSIVFSRARRFAVWARTSRLSRQQLLAAIVSLLALSGFLVVQLARQAGGILALILSGYHVTQLFNGQGIYVIGLAWIQLLSVLLLAFGGAYRSRTVKLCAFALAFIVVASLLIMARRQELVLVGVAYLIVWHFTYARLRPMLLVGILVAGFIALNLVGMIRGHRYDSVSHALTSLTQGAATYGSGDANALVYTLTTGEFVVPFASLPEVMSHMGNDVQYQWGTASLRSVALLVPTAVWQDRPIPLSNWYMRQFYDHNATMNITRAFFLLTGFYLDFGVFGVVILGLLYTAVFAAAVIFLARRLDNPIFLSMFAMFIGNSLPFVSGDAVSGAIAFVKTIAPLLLLAGTAWIIRPHSVRLAYRRNPETSPPFRSLHEYPAD